MSMQEVDKLDIAAGKDLEQVKYWNTQIDASKKKEKKWREEAKGIEDLYEAKKVEANSFNILYSNTETLLPAIYTQLPRPIVQRRFKDSDPLGKAAGQALSRVLQYLLQQPDGEYASFDSLFEGAVLGALLPGRGVVRFRYDPEFAPLPAPGQPPASGDGDADDGPYDAGEGEVSQPSTTNEAVQESQPDAQEQVVYETICGVGVHYTEVHLGIAKKWKDVPFVAFEYQMTKADVKNNFGEDWVTRLPFTAPMDEEGKPRYEDDNCPAEDKICAVYEIWVKSEKKVLFVARDFKDKIIKELDDPLGLEGFYPMPEPLSFLLKTADLTPTPLYKLYEEQAKELNRITQRINRIVNALKVRGVFDNTIKEISELMNAEDNILVGATNVSSFQQGYSLDKAIWLMPIDKLITVLQQLYLQRQQCKQVIYEITGISDILRGASVASETATAQNIKNQWGTLRLKRLQRKAANYVRDCLRIMAEIASEKFSEDTFAKMTGLPFVSTQEKQQAQQLLQQMQSHLALQQQGQMPPQPPVGPPGQPPQPPGPPPMSPEMQQQMQQLQKTANTISWGEILGVLRDDLSRNFRIDIETNSTVDPAATEDQQQITEVMNALGLVFQSVGPVVEKGVLPLAALKQMILAVTRRFVFGEEIEEALEAMPEQMPKQDDPKVAIAQQKAQADQAKGQQDMKIAADKHDMDMKKLQAQNARDERKAQLESQLQEEELQFQREELQMKREMLSLKRQEGMDKLQLLREQGNQKLQQGRQQMVLGAMQGQQQLEQGEQSHTQSLQHQDQAAKAKAKAAAKQPKAKVN